MLHLDDFSHAGSTAPHVYEQLPGERSGVHAGARERQRIRRTELEREAASSQAPAFTQAPYVPGCSCTSGPAMPSEQSPMPDSLVRY